MNTQTLHTQIVEAIKFLDAKDYPQAEERFREILKNNPEQTDALLGIAQIFLNKHIYPVALEYAQKAVASNPRNTFCLGFATQILIKLGMFDEAKQYAQKAYKLEPKTKNGIKTYLLYLEHIHDAPTTQKLVSQLLKIDKSAVAYSTAGLAFENIDKNIESIRAFRNGIRLALANKNPPPPPNNRLKILNKPNKRRRIH